MSPPPHHPPLALHARFSPANPALAPCVRPRGELWVLNLLLHKAFFFKSFSRAPHGQTKRAAGRVSQATHLAYDSYYDYNSSKFPWIEAVYNYPHIIDKPVQPCVQSNTKGYSSAYLAMGFANVRAGTRYPPEH